MKDTFNRKCLLVVVIAVALIIIVMALSVSIYEEQHPLSGSGSPCCRCSPRKQRFWWRNRTVLRSSRRL